jgi:predicted metal-dependent hydrolase
MKHSEGAEIAVDGVTVRVIRKNIKNLHLGVYPPNGQVRLSVPRRLSQEAVVLAVAKKMAWIKKQQSRIVAQNGAMPLAIISGESHCYLGRRYPLRVMEREGRSGVSLRDLTTLELTVQPGSTRDERQRTLDNWYRQRLRDLVPPLLGVWQEKLGVQAAEWRIRKMRTKWGSCSIRAKRIWLNLELAKKPAQCLEYVVVHELTHLIERRHNARFKSLMDKSLPMWRVCRKLLNDTGAGDTQ